jgi:excisionase family DNA binding protein
LAGGDEFGPEANSMSRKQHPPPLYYSSPAPAGPVGADASLAAALLWDVLAAERIAALPREEAEQDETPGGDRVVAGQRLSVAEAAEMLAVSPATMYALCAHKRIRHERHGSGRGTIRIPTEALEEYRRSVTINAEREPEKPPPVPLRHIRT